MMSETINRTSKPAKRNARSRKITTAEVALHASDTIALERIFPGESEMARLMRAFDWAQTPLGPVERWPQPLRAAVNICLTSRFPIVLWWGPELTLLYNDAYQEILGAKHPASLSAAGRTV